jgi:hypothetical protein
MTFGGCDISVSFKPTAYLMPKKNLRSARPSLMAVIRKTPTKGARICHHPNRQLETRSREYLTAEEDKNLSRGSKNASDHQILRESLSFQWRATLPCTFSSATSSKIRSSSKNYIASNNALGDYQFKSRKALCSVLNQVD